MGATSPETSERESLKVAEASRQTEWAQPSFMRELFLGNFRLDLIHPYPLPGADRPEFARLLRARCERFLRDDVDSVGDRRHRASTRRPCSTSLRQHGRLRHEDPEGVRRARLHQRRVPEGHAAPGQQRTATSSPSSPRTSRSACPSPLKLFGSREPEEEVPAPLRARARSPPSPSPSPRSGPTRARLSTTAEKTADGDGLRPQRHQALVHERHPGQAAGGDGRATRSTRKISAFVVETAWPGVKVEHRSRFMGLRALANARHQLHGRPRAGGEPHRRRKGAG